MANYTTKVYEVETSPSDKSSVQTTQSAPISKYNEPGIGRPAAAGCCTDRSPKESIRSVQAHSFRGTFDSCTTCLVVEESNALVLEVLVTPFGGTSVTPADIQKVHVMHVQNIVVYRVITEYPSKDILSSNFNC